MFYFQIIFSCWNNNYSVGTTATFNRFSRTWARLRSSRNWPLIAAPKRRRDLWKYGKCRWIVRWRDWSGSRRRRRTRSIHCLPACYSLQYSCSLPPLLPPLLPLLPPKALRLSVCLSALLLTAFSFVSTAAAAPKYHSFTHSLTHSLANPSLRQNYGGKKVPFFTHTQKWNMCSLVDLLRLGQKCTSFFLYLWCRAQLSLWSVPPPPSSCSVFRLRRRYLCSQLTQLPTL